MTPDGARDAEFFRELEAFDVGALPKSLREQAAAAWAKSALAEHASIASFNRFCLDLLAVGAPAEHVEACQRAAMDEIDHARLSFALASRYAGRPLGPGPIPIPSDLGLAKTLADAAASCAEEGCVGETLSALEATAAAELAAPRPVRLALELIAADEARHAELAWSFVSWALRVGDGSVERAVRDAFTRALAGAATGVADTTFDVSLERHGHLSGARRRELRARAVEQTLRPACDALLGGSARGTGDPVPRG